MLIGKSVESLHIGDTKEVELTVGCPELNDDGISRASYLLMTFIQAERSQLGSPELGMSRVIFAFCSMTLSQNAKITRKIPSSGSPVSTDHSTLSFR